MLSPQKKPKTLILDVLRVPRGNIFLLLVTFFKSVTKQHFVHIYKMKQNTHTHTHNAQQHTQFLSHYSPHYPKDQENINNKIREFELIHSF